MALSRRGLLAALAASAMAVLRPFSASAGGNQMRRRKARTTPLFHDLDDARAVIKQVAIEEADAPISQAQADMLLTKLGPQFWLAPHNGPPAAGLGVTRLGGAPDLPAGVEWPIRPLPADGEDLIKSYARDDTEHWLIRHARAALPFEFLAQINLAEAAAHQGFVPGLPDQGRLLFFWDGVLGLFVSGPRACRVIHDAMPANELSLSVTPDKLHELDRLYDPGGKYKKPYVYPSRQMQLQPIVALPAFTSADASVDADLGALFKNDELLNTYQTLTANDDGAFEPDAGRNVRRQRFMGVPDPEQDDPRFDAIVGEDGYARPPWRGSELAAASQAALHWQLLLQVDFRDLSQQELTEGTIYFLIRKADLAKQDFSRVSAVYQQT